jgi:23S rRNA (guanosine2251-2'-O)-methyltransferase
VTSAAVKASAGATEYVKIARVVNISAAIAQLKNAGVWIAGADMNGEPMRSAAMKGPLALVIGNEGEGLSKLVRENCDFLVSIPMQGHIDSLNAGVAAAILYLLRVPVPESINPWKKGVRERFITKT